MYDWIFWLEFLAAWIDAGLIIALLLDVNDSMDEE